MSSNSDVVGIALAGVLAWHPNSLDAIALRALLPLANRPWLEHFIERMRRGGIDRVAVSVNRLSGDLVGLARRLTSEIGDLQLFVDVPPRGAAGCCRDAAELMPAARYVIVESLVMPRLGIDDLLQHHCKTGAVATLVVEGDEESAGASASCARPVGILVVERDFVLTAPETGYQDLKEVLLNRAVRGGARVGAYRSQVSNPRISDLRSYLDAHAELILSGREDGAASVVRDRRAASSPFTCIPQPKSVPAHALQGRYSSEQAVA